MKIGRLSPLLLVAGCSLTISPVGEAVERSKIAAEGIPYRTSVSQREVPDLTAQASLRDVVLYSLIVNGEIEASYFKWAGAMERVVTAGALPDPMLSLQILSVRENFSTLNAFLDSLRVMLSQELPAQGKRTKEAEIALIEAKVAGEEFRATRSELYAAVIQAYSELQATEQFTIETETTLKLLQQSQDLSTHRFHSGTATALIDIRKLQLEIETQRSELRGLTNKRINDLAALNRLLNREPTAPLGKLDPMVRQLPLAPYESLAAMVLERNPVLRKTQLQDEVSERAVERAELEHFPDYGANIGIDDMIRPIIGASVKLPLNQARIMALVKGAEAMRAASAARIRSAESDALVTLSLAMTAVRDSERIITDVKQKLLPETEDLLQLQQGEYASGEGEILSILDTERALSALRQLEISARARRITAYADIAEVTAQDLFALFPENSSGQLSVSEESK